MKLKRLGRIQDHQRHPEDECGKPATHFVNVSVVDWWVKLTLCSDHAEANRAACERGGYECRVETL
jgi:hypothetical protein